MTIERSTFDDYGEIVAPATPAAGKVRVFADSADKKLKAKDDAGVTTVIGGGPPGTWTQLAKGPTTVADNAQVTLATLSGIADGEVVVPFVSARDDVSLEEFGGQTSIATPAGTGVFSVEKTTTADQHLFRFKQRSGAAMTVDWVVYKVLPT